MTTFDNTKSWQRFEPAVLHCVRDGQEGQQVADDADGGDDDRPRAGKLLEGGNVDGEAGVRWWSVNGVVGAGQPQLVDVDRAVAGQSEKFGCSKSIVTLWGH